MFALQPGDTGCIANPLAYGAGPQNRLLRFQEDEKSAPPPPCRHMPFYLAVPTLPYEDNINLIPYNHAFYILSHVCFK